MKWLASIGIFAVLAIILGGWFFFGSTKGRQTLTPVSVRLAWLNQAQFTGMYVAKDKGFYADEGLDVSFREYDSGDDQGKEVAEGKATFAVASAQEVISFIDQGDPIKAVAVIYQISPYAFASLKSLNIMSPLDLRGKILGLAGGSQESQVTYRALLSRYEIPLKSVTFKTLGFDTPGDVKDHNADVVDLYRTDQVYVLQKEGVQFNLLKPEQFDFGIYGDSIIASSSAIEKNPDLVRRFVRATIKGWEYAIAHESEALAIDAKYQNQQYDDPEYEKFIFEQSVPLIRVSGGHIGDMQYLKWKKAYDAMLDAGVLKSKFKVSDVYVSLSL